MNNYEDPSVLCPFYKEERPFALICEGPNTYTSVHMCFHPTSRKKSYKQTYCMDHYNDCLLAKGLNKMWDEKL